MPDVPARNMSARSTTMPARDHFLQVALKYNEMGFSVIPCRPEKSPYIHWTEYQTRRATSDEITAWWLKWPDAMIGVVTGMISNLFVIDCDTPEGYQAIQNYIPDSSTIPVATTPRGGWHLYFVYPRGSGLTVGVEVMPGVDYRGEGGFIIVPPSINGTGRGYTWQEGFALGEVEPATVPESLLKNILLYARKRINNYTPESHRKPHNTTETTNIFTEGRRDEDLFHHAFVLLKGGMEKESVAQTIDFLAINCVPPYPVSDARRKVESAFQRFSQRDDGHFRNIASEIEEWVSTTQGNFKTTDSHRELQIATKEQKKAAMMAFLRLKERGIIEKVGASHGCYRRIDTTVEYMDFASADIENTVNLILPLGLHSKTKIFPKGVIVIAGVSGMGKTLFAFNTIAENMRRFPIFYFNSEMGPEALKEKLSHFPIPISDWNRHMKVIDNWDFNSIPDKIQPDALNVIDYLEPEGDKAYNIHGVISAIIRRLNKGTALIAIQKKPGATMGTGGIYSIKAATLALSLDWGKIEIIKNRFRESDSFPSLNKINFEVHQGCKFVKQGGWYR